MRADICTCGEQSPNDGITHRTDGPCYVDGPFATPEPATSRKPDPERLEALAAEARTALDKGRYDEWLEAKSAHAVPSDDRPPRERHGENPDVSNRQPEELLTSHETILTFESDEGERVKLGPSDFQGHLRHPQEAEAVDPEGANREVGPMQPVPVEDASIARQIMGEVLSPEGPPSWSPFASLALLELLQLRALAREYEALGLIYGDSLVVKWAHSAVAMCGIQREGQRAWLDLMEVAARAYRAIPLDESSLNLDNDDDE